MCFGADDNEFNDEPKTSLAPVIPPAKPLPRIFRDKHTGSIVVHFGGTAHYLSAVGTHSTSTLAADAYTKPNGTGRFYDELPVLPG